MRTMLFGLLSLLILGIPFLLPAQAQVTTGTLEGRVLDAAGQPLGGVQVVATSPSLQGARSRLTTPQGVFILVALPVGEYEVKITHTAHTTQIIEGIRVRLGQTTSLATIRLQGQAYRLEDTVVYAQTPLIDPTSTVVGANLRAADYAALPIDRDFQSVVTLLPHANESFLGDPANLAGATGLENRYFIDGIDVTDPVRNVGGTRLPHNFVREMQVRTGAYEAEFRSSLGGTINAVTYSGGNEFRGQVFGYYVNNRFSDEPRLGALEPTIGDFAHYDVGISLGGPVKKDRLWYYLAYNPAFEREDVDVPGCGFHEDRTTTYSFAGKLTWRASDRHTFVCTAIGDPTTRRAIGDVFAVTTIPTSLANPDPYLMDFRTGGVNLLAEGRHLVRDGLLLETRLSWGRREDERIPATELGRSENLFIDQETGEWSGGATDYFDESSTVVVAGVDCSWLAGNHELKTGVEYKDSRWNLDQSMDTLIRFADDYYFWFIAGTEGQVSNRILSTFLQDSWRMTDRLRINVGLRWDGQYFVSSKNEVAQTILDQWQPRIGVVYQPGEMGIHRLSASFGRYYQELPTYPLHFHYNDQGRWDWIYYDHDPRNNPAGGDTLAWPYVIRPEIDLEGQYFDEVTLGYQRRMSASSTITLRGIYRTLRQVVEDGIDPVSLEYVLGNPGRGDMSAFPAVKREYAAFQVSWQQRAGSRLGLLASYVLSRSYGNYPGMFHEWGFEQPNAAYFDRIEQLDNAEGLLPNDRTHVLKIAGSYRLGAGVTLGAVGTWASGTPQNELGAFPDGYPLAMFLQTRGTAGRTPSIWDLDVRATYEPSISPGSRWRPRVTVDILHVASQREPVLYDYVHYFDVDEEGNQISPNPTYNMPTRYQPPMAVRVGVELRF